MSPLPEIDVLIPLYHGRNTIKDCLESLMAQQEVSLKPYMLDNGCPENTGEWAGYVLAQHPSITWVLLEEPHNIGFASGMNRLYAESSSELILFLNQDVVLAPDHLKILASALERHPDWAGAGGTLYRIQDNAPRTIDTTGHLIFHDRIVRNRGAGKVVGDTFLSPFPEGEIFGLSAACVLYRRSALEASREKEGPFDPDFFSYFEDIDLDYRIHRSGWKSGYAPDATGWHALAGSGGRKELEVRTRAYGNRCRILWKHESFSSLIPDIFPILAQDIYSFMQTLLTDPLVWLTGPWVLLPSISSILARRKRMDKKWGVDRNWIKKWLRPESERFSER
jgi:GT2 family glycosyltransferase